MKFMTAICGILSLMATAVLPSGLRAQGITLGGSGSMLSGMPLAMGVGPDGSMSMAGEPVQSGSGLADPLQQLLSRGAGDSRHPIIVLDSVRANEDDLISFAQSLRSGKVRIKQGGVRTFTGDSKEVEKYGAKADDKVILISTEPGTAAPAADSSTAKH